LLLSLPCGEFAFASFDGHGWFAFERFASAERAVRRLGVWDIDEFLVIQDPKASLFEFIAPFSLDSVAAVAFNRLVRVSLA
jgi:hypothetical protein